DRELRHRQHRRLAELADRAGQHQRGHRRARRVPHVLKWTAGGLRQRQLVHLRPLSRDRLAVRALSRLTKEWRYRMRGTSAALGLLAATTLALAGRSKNNQPRSTVDNPERAVVLGVSRLPRAPPAAGARPGREPAGR